MENAASSKLSGAELEVRYLPFSNTEIWANYGYLKTEFRNYVDSEGTDCSGKEFPYSARQTAAVGLTQHFADGIYYSESARVRGGYCTDETNEVKLSGIGTVNMKLGYLHSSGFDVFVYAE
ncbi:MAG: TonB-dependent receptor [Verrucomicrobiaceae bacterium]|nr:TonB-dependent receptor [Verrucomicrobiaceae bacterium]